MAAHESNKSHYRDSQPISSTTSRPYRRMRYGRRRRGLTLRHLEGKLFDIPQDPTRCLHRSLRPGKRLPSINLSSRWLTASFDSALTRRAGKNRHHVTNQLTTGKFCVPSSCKPGDSGRRPLMNADGQLRMAITPLRKFINNVAEDQWPNHEARSVASFWVFSFEY